MRSVRLDDQMENRVRRAAAAEGVSVSEFIRRAADQRAQQTLSSGGDERLADVVGVIRSGRRQARRSGKVFADLVAEQHRKSR
jgi:Ribbon-helix-helix protein, copG family